MRTLNIAEAKGSFSSLLEDIRLGGEGVIVSRYGAPVAMIVSYSPSAAGTATSAWDKRGRRTDVNPALSKIVVKGDVLANDEADWEEA